MSFSVEGEIDWEAITSPQQLFDDIANKVNELNLSQQVQVQLTCYHRESDQVDYAFVIKGQVLSTNIGAYEQLKDFATQKGVISAFEVDLIGDEFPNDLSVIRPFSTDNKQTSILSFEEMKGKNYFIIDFWATWCKQCEPFMQNNCKIASIQKKGAPMIVACSFDTNLEDLQKTIKKKWTNLFHLWIGPKGMPLLRHGVPARWVIDKNGIIKAKDHPATLSMERIQELIDNNFSVTAASHDHHRDGSSVPNEPKKWINVEEKERLKILEEIRIYLRFYERISVTDQETSFTFNGITKQNREILITGTVENSKVKPLGSELSSLLQKLKIGDIFVQIYVKIAPLALDMPNECSSCKKNIRHQYSQYVCAVCETQVSLCGTCFNQLYQGTSHDGVKHDKKHFFFKLVSQKQTFKDLQYGPKVLKVKMENGESEDQTVHSEIYCNGCKDEKKDIQGIRYKCAQCPDYDLCKQCHDMLPSPNIHDESHVFIQLHSTNYNFEHFQPMDLSQDE